MSNVGKSLTKEDDKEKKRKSNICYNQPQGVVASSTSKAVCYATADASQSSAWFTRPSTSITATVSQATQRPFPTLNSQFYPQAAQIDRSYQDAPSTIPPQSGSTPEYYNSQNHFQGVLTMSRHVRQHKDQSYSSLLTEPARYPMAYLSQLDHGEHMCHQPLPGYIIVPFSPLLPLSLHCLSPHTSHETPTFRCFGRRLPLDSH